MKDKILEQLEEEYEHLKELFGIGSSCWNMLHKRCSSYVFCEENRGSLIAEYLILEDFASRAKKEGFVYYYGIDVFLKEYKKAVYDRLNLQ